jgi:hypothetical protein
VPPEEALSFFSSVFPPLSFTTAVRSRMYNVTLTLFGGKVNPEYR